MDPWQKRVGSHGCTVILRERQPGGTLYVYVPQRWGGYKKKSLKHRDRDQGEAYALKLAARLREAAALGLRKRSKLPLRLVFASYELDVSTYKKGQQPKEDRRRIELWEAFFGEKKDARRITRNDLKRFLRVRKAGKIQVAERELIKRPSATTVGADIVFLRSVMNWAVADGLIRVNPIARFRIPRTRRPKQPVATFDRFLRVYRHSHKVGQSLFREFFLLIGNELDWRVSALCQLRVSHIDLNPRPEAPHGRVWRALESDKFEDGGWVPLSPRGKKALQRAMRKRAAIGDVYLFESPRRRGKPWRRQYARDLLEKAEARARLEPLDGGDFHPYRRRWSTERKHHPWSDIAAVSGRKCRKTFERSYAKADPKTILAVVMEPRRLRELVHFYWSTRNGKQKAPHRN